MRDILNEFLKLWKSNIFKLLICVSSVLLLSYLAILVFTGNSSQMELLPGDTITNIDENFVNKKYESQEVTHNSPTFFQGLEFWLLFSTAIFTITAIAIAKATLEQKEKENQTRLLVELLKDWDSSKMQLARASLCLKYLNFMATNENTFKYLETRTIIKKFLEKENASYQFKKYLNKLYSTPRKITKSDLEYLPQNEEAVLKFFERLGMFYKRNSLNERHIWECFISKIEPYYHEIGHHFIQHKRQYTKGYFFYYDYLVTNLCNQTEYIKMKKHYGDTEEHKGFNEFKHLCLKEKISRTIYLALSETRSLYMITSEKP